MQELLVNVVRRDRDWRPKRPRILFEHLLLHWPLFAEGLERLDTVPESSFEEIPRPVVFACFFVQIQSIEVWHTKNVLWLMSIDQKFDCKGRSEPCRVLCQILRRRESKDGFRSAFPINACKSIIHCFPLNLGYQSLRMGCLRTILVEFIWYVQENPIHIHLEESGEFFPHEVPRLHAVVVGIGHEQLPQIFHFVHGTLALVLFTLKVAFLIDVGVL